MTEFINNYFTANQTLTYKTLHGGGVDNSYLKPLLCKVFVYNCVYINDT